MLAQQLLGGQFVAVDFLRLQIQIVDNENPYVRRCLENFRSTISASIQQFEGRFFVRMVDQSDSWIRGASKTWQVCDYWRLAAYCIDYRPSRISIMADSCAQRKPVGDGEIVLRIKPPVPTIVEIFFKSSGGTVKMALIFVRIVAEFSFEGKLMFLLKGMAQSH